MSEAGRVQGVVVAHGSLAEALVDATQRITGCEPGVLRPLSNEGLGPEAIRDRIGELLQPGPAIIFTDLREGSCGMAARRLCLEREDHVLVAGANLPMLLDFALHVDLPLAELVERVVSRGRSAVAAVPEIASG